jgi:tetratricopeptide (TPR) repeat protein
MLAWGLIVVGCGGLSAEDAKKSTAQYELAVGLQQEGNMPGAFQALARSLEHDPNNAKAYLLLGTLYLLVRDDAPAEYDRKAEQAFREVIRIQQTEYRYRENLAADAYNKLGVLYIHQGRHGDAVRELKVAVGDIYNRKAYLAWGNLGWVYYKDAKYDKAVEALTRSVELERRFCVGYYRLGEVYQAMRAFEKSEKALTQALEADPRCEALQVAWRLRGEVRANLGAREEAIGDFERCVELNPESEAGQACSRLLEASN